MNLTQEEAARIHALLPKGDTLRSKIEVKYPLLRGMVKSWEELGSIEGYFVAGSDIMERREFKTTPSGRNLFATIAQAKSHGIAGAMLSQLMKDLGDECVVDWGDGNQGKWCIILQSEELKIWANYITKHFLAFKTESTAREFMRLHLELIKEYWSF